MTNRYNCRNRRKYSLKVHIVLVTKYRKQILRGSIADEIKQKIFDICNMMQQTGFVKLLKQLNSKQLFIYGKNIRTFCLSSIGRKRFFGLMGILSVAQENGYTLEQCLKMTDARFFLD